MIQMRPSVAVSAVVNSIRQFYDAGSGVTQTTMLGASGSAPALYEDFTTGQALDPRITFTRGSSATRFNSSGTLVTMSSNEPRFDYDPVTLAPKGLLIEEQRTNLLTYSEQFDNAAWVKTGTTVSANAAIAPDGTSTPDKLVETAVTNEHNVVQPVTVVSGTAYTLSIYAKKAERSYVILAFGSGFAGTPTRAWFNLTNGTVGTLINSPTASISDVGNGWYRCSITKTATLSGSANNVVNTSTADNILSYAGDGISGIYIWGAQLEAGAFPTSYIPTTTAAATRSADIATMTGTNFSSWYNQAEGTLFAEATPQASNVASCALFEVGDATVNNRIGLFKLVTSGNASLAVQVSNVGQASTNNGAWPTTGKFAGGYKVDDFASAINGGTPVTDSIGTVPSVTQATIGRRQDGASILNGHIRRIAYFPRRLANSELQALTA